MFFVTGERRSVPRRKSCSATPTESRANRGSSAKVFNGTNEYVCDGSGIGHVAVGTHRQGYDLRLTHAF
jgi:hypothetical protein